MKKTFWITLLTVMLIAANFETVSGDTPMNDPNNPPVLPGHLKKGEELMKIATDIIVGKFTSLGNGSTDSPGASFYEKADLTVINSLKGSLSGNIQASYSVRTFPLNKKEAQPTIGTQYVMFIQKLGPTEYEIKKLLPATDDSITKVKALIAAPAAK